MKSKAQQLDNMFAFGEVDKCCDRGSGEFGVTLKHKTTTFVFVRHLDNKWRWCFVTNYGNTQFVDGDDCGPSGYEIRDREQLELLESCLRNFEDHPDVAPTASTL